MISRDDLPETPDWYAQAQRRNACSNCTMSERFCSLNTSWNHARCCDRCGHDLEHEPDVELGEN